MKILLKRGATSKSIDVLVRDSSSSTGAGLTGLLFDTTSLVAHYHRPGAAAADITLADLATPVITDVWASGGFLEVHATKLPGLYRLDLPNAVIASGVDEVVVMLHGAANMEPVALEIQLVDLDPNVAMKGTDGANTAVPPTVAAFEARTIIAANYATAGGLADVPTVAEFDARTLVSSGYATASVLAAVPTTSEFEARTLVSSGYATAAILGAVPTTTEFEARTLAAASYATAAALTTVDGVVDAILLDTVEIGTAGLGLTNVGGFSTAAILAIWHQAMAQVVTAGSVGKLLKDEMTSVRMATLTDLIDGGRLDVLIDAIKVVTDLMNAATTEPTGAPPASVTPIQALQWWYHFGLRNKVDSTGTLLQYYNNAGSVQFKRTLSGSGSLWTREETVIV